ncbi:hypothetical protein [Faecalibacterium duncaniae]|uniref:hypothetical protein n=1 Tax=Faecalibacterium duncaniae (strain DSM 17677 / JCM 31915 / A2-165) TaxID=411483 RepID=UPI00209DCF6D|nr:hypothetical protein [Faecalibacterium duncaniae]UTB40069.1 hypothetical protein NKF69_12500 [Faecalibacterium duncaniae]
MNENQTTYPTGAQDEEEIDLVALMVTLLHKLKPILLTAVVCAVLFGGVAGVRAAKGGSTSAEKQKAYEQALDEYEQKKADYAFEQKQYEQSTANNQQMQKQAQETLEQAQDYAENSLLGQLNAYNVWTAQADVYVDTADASRTAALLTAYSNQLTSGDALEQAAEAVNLQARYLTGAIAAEPQVSGTETVAYSGVLTLRAYAADQVRAQAMLDAMLGQLNRLHDSISAAVGSHDVRVISTGISQGVSMELRAAQQENNADIQELQSQLVELQSAQQTLDDNWNSTKSDWKNISEPALDGGAASSVAKYLLIGFLLGGVLACGVVVVRFLLDGMVYSASELNRSTGLPVLGALASDRTKKAGKLDAKLYQMEGRPDGSADAEMLCLMAQTIRSRAPEAKNILVTGDLPADQLEALAAALQATEPLRGQSVTAAESILKAAATVPHVVAADAIVLAADCTVTRTDAVREQNEKIVRLGKQILGCIVYE